jgi:oxygen-independent coproporphyrinogen-3 oxidase
VSVPFQVYIHVPYCARRCGYCDFNTYVAPAAQRAHFVAAASREMELAALELERRGLDGREAQSVFLGGGTPTLLPAADLVTLLEAVRRIFGLAAGAEVTTEANPDSVDAEYLEQLAAGGFGRISIGMQSAVAPVLAALDRTHAADRVEQVVSWAHRLGLAASVDLIYGTPGESLADWERSLRAALDLEVGHISAYALTLEPHTPMARRIRAGQLGSLDPDEQATKYQLADQLLEASGRHWYEISNWALPGQASRHNLGYWTGADWWGIGPGAHSALGGTRFWNVKHPQAYARQLELGQLPVAGYDQPDAAGLALERLMLRLRTAQGLA